SPPQRPAIVPAYSRAALVPGVGLNRAMITALGALHSPAPMAGVCVKGGGKTVLVVDDDDSLRMLCRINLELEGYSVVEASSIEGAHQVLAGGPRDRVPL